MSVRHRIVPSHVALTALLAALASPPSPARALPGEYLSVTDPLRAELRVLELYENSPSGPSFGFVHTGTQPPRLRELLEVAHPLSRVGGPRGIALTRLGRVLGREANADGIPLPMPGVTPRIWSAGEPNGDRLEVSLGLEGEAQRHDPRRDGESVLADGSGAHLRAGARVDRWIAYTHLWAGQLDGAERFTDALVKGTDVALQTEESYLAYDGGAAWGLMLGRNRWHWGPGDEASLLVSRSSAPMTGLLLHLRIASLRLDATALHATLETGSGEQLAAHRVEWQARDGLRLGLTETARYRSSGLQLAYLASVMPFSLVQRLADQDADGDTSGARRNNVAIGLDAAWRVADGTRVYGELLLDDLHAESSDYPNKLGYQLGAEGVGDIRGTRFGWNTEYTRISRYTYTSFYGRAYVAQGRPIGFPTGPDSERLRVRLSWDPDPAWQVNVSAARTVRGESGLDVPFTPGDDIEPGVWSFAGTPERARRVEGGIRWWPAGGVDLSLALARERTQDAGHVAGASTSEWQGVARVRLVR